jgi:hypothetical protein
MGRPDCVWLFESGRWDNFSPFFYPRGCVRTRGGRMGRPAEDGPKRACCCYGLAAILGWFPCSHSLLFDVALASLFPQVIKLLPFMGYGVHSPKTTHMRLKFTLTFG